VSRVINLHVDAESQALYTNTPRPATTMGDVVGRA
jgi:hypothetical protein